MANLQKLQAARLLCVSFCWLWAAHYRTSHRVVYCSRQRRAWGCAIFLGDLHGAVRADRLCWFYWWLFQLSPLSHPICIPCPCEGGVLRKKMQGDDVDHPMGWINTVRLSANRCLCSIQLAVITFKLQLILQYQWPNSLDYFLTERHFTSFRLQ